jgi:hypothetical protein
MILGSQTRVFIIVEAELDGLAIIQAAGDLVSVVALGSLSMRPDSRTSALLGKSKIILNALDLDIKSNNQKTLRDSRYNLDWWKRHYPQTERWPVPAGKDPGEAYQRGVDLRNWVMAALPSSFLPAASQQALQAVLPPETESPIEELIGLLRIIIYDNRYSRKLDRPRKWACENLASSNRLSRLVFYDRTVKDLLNSLPDGYYNAGKLAEIAS